MAGEGRSNLGMKIEGLPSTPKNAMEWIGNLWNDAANVSWILSMLSDLESIRQSPQPYHLPRRVEIVGNDFDAGSLAANLLTCSLLLEFALWGAQICYFNRSFPNM